MEKEIVAFFENISSVVAVILFGSRAQNRTTNKSDIDLAILFERAEVPDSFTLIEMRERLSDLLRNDIDLVCLNTASPIICMQVYKNGKILIERDSRKLDSYLTALFVDYIELKEIRAASEKNILKRKYYD